MRRNDALLALALSVCTTSCGTESAAEQAVRIRQPADAATPVAIADATPATQASTDFDAIPPPSAADARQVVIDYYAAIGARDYTTAYALWSNDGTASGQNFEHFSGGYSNTESVEAEVGEATGEEGAAGSRYISVPVELRARQYNGTLRSYRGRFALRAVMADGASEEQRRWHLDSAEMQRLR